MKIDLSGININRKYIRWAIIAVVAVILIIVTRKIWRNMKEAADRKELIDKMNHDVVTSELTYSEAQYLQFATTVYEALNDKTSGFWGVDQAKIYEVYKQMKTQSDVLRLHDAFGSKEIDAAWTMGSSASGTYTLASALPRLLTKKQLREVNRILADNGVQFSY